MGSITGMYAFDGLCEKGRLYAVLLKGTSGNFSVSRSGPVAVAAPFGCNRNRDRLLHLHKATNRDRNCGQPVVTGCCQVTTGFNQSQPYIGTLFCN